MGAAYDSSTVYMYTLTYNSGSSCEICSACNGEVVSGCTKFSDTVCESDIESDSKEETSDSGSLSCDTKVVVLIDSSMESSSSSATDQSSNGLDGSFVGDVELRDAGYFFPGDDDTYIDFGSEVLFNGWTAITVYARVFPESLMENSDPNGHTTDQNIIIHTAGEAENDNFGLSVTTSYTTCYVSTSFQYFIHTVVTQSDL